MGTDKAFLELQGHSLLSIALEVAKSICDNVYIVGPKSKFAEFVEVVEDQYAGRGPLAGIDAALQATATPLNLVLAVDLPFLTASFLTYLVEQSRLSKALVTVPQAGKGFQPLCAVYHQGLRGAVRRALEQGENKIDSLFSAVPVRVISEAELQGRGFSASLFDNLNTKRDLEGAQRRLAVNS